VREPVRGRMRDRPAAARRDPQRPNGRGTGDAERTERVRSLVEPVLARHDVELVELAVKRGRTQLVRLVVDRAGGIDLDTCARVSEELSRMLDADDPIAGRYTLEVTSPGLDRPLRTPADFRRALGRRVRIVMATGQHEGTLEEVGEDRVRVATSGEQIEVPLGEIAVAKVVLPW
jgi:ribosome maturation factor RimP